ncbi:ribonuclease H-like domain-containing protein [Tanacetum coccineum]|uniref:Ribonuclease H-like domain-containing protein n=1 Tax=Tanacetum coccineum TaxID=301880 RepID=A0ABQ5IXU0_9ASTR
MDVKTAFSTVLLKEEVYVSQPKGLLKPEFPNHVYRLKKALYGLKQAPRAWYDKLSSFPNWHTDDDDFKALPTVSNELSSMKERAMYLTPVDQTISFATLQSYNMGLWYPKDSGFELIAYSDADHAGCKDDCKSTSGGVQFLGGKLVSWSSKKQDCTAMSTAEAEYVSLSACCCSK